MDWVVLVVAVLWALWVLVAMAGRARRSARPLAERRREPRSHVRVIEEQPVSTDPDTRDEDLDQCGRCGSSVGHADCGTCAALGELEAGGYGNPHCPICHGTGTMLFCLSTAEWCEANPLPGCEDLPRHSSAREGSA